MHLLVAKPPSASRQEDGVLPFLWFWSVLFPRWKHPPEWRCWCTLDLVEKTIFVVIFNIYIIIKRELYECAKQMSSLSLSEMYSQLKRREMCVPSLTKLSIYFWMTPNQIWKYSFKVTMEIRIEGQEVCRGVPISLYRLWFTCANSICYESKSSLFKFLREVALTLEWYIYTIQLL